MGFDELIINPNESKAYNLKLFHTRCRKIIGKDSFEEMNALINQSKNDILDIEDKSFILSELISVLLYYTIFEYENRINKESSVKNRKEKYIKIDLIDSFDNYVIDDSGVNYGKQILIDFFYNLRNDKYKKTAPLNFSSEHFYKILKSDILNQLFKEDESILFDLFSFIIKTYTPTQNDCFNGRHLKLMKFFLFENDLLNKVVLNRENTELLNFFIKSFNDLIVSTNNVDYEIFLNKILHDKSNSFDHFFNLKDKFNDVSLNLFSQILKEENTSNIILKFFLSNININSKMDKIKEVIEMEQMTRHDKVNEILKSVTTLSLILNRLDVLEMVKPLFISDNNKEKINFLVKTLINENFLVDFLNEMDFTIDNEGNKQQVLIKLEKFNNEMLNNKTKTKINKINLRKF